MECDLNNYHVLFLDMDGTILRTDHSISDKTKEAIRTVQEKGMEVFLATGRPIHEIREIANELQIQSMIGYNGALGIYKGDIIVEQPMSPHVIDHYLQVAQSNDNEMVLYTDTYNLFTNLDNERVKHFIDFFGFKNCHPFEINQKENILGITLINVTNKEIKLYDIAAEDIDFAPINIQGMDHCFDVIRDQVNKGIAIQAILNKLHLSPDQAIAFGDGLNDIQMLSSVGAGFAMGNAHPDLLPFAKYQTKSVDEDGVYHGLKSLGLL